MDHQLVPDASPHDTRCLFFFNQNELLDEDQFVQIYRRPRQGKLKKKEAVFKARGGGRVIDCGAWQPVV